MEILTWIHVELVDSTLFVPSIMPVDKRKCQFFKEMNQMQPNVKNQQE